MSDSVKIFLRDAKKHRFQIDFFCSHDSCCEEISVLVMVIPSAVVLPIKAVVYYKKKWPFT